MDLDSGSFVNRYDPGAIHFGRDCVADVGEILASTGLSRALVVCGSTVGANERVLDPLTSGLGDRLVDVFDETTPEKSIEAAQAGVEVMRDRNVDVLVGVGGGSSLDVARAMSVIDGRGESFDEIRAEALETGRIRLPDDTDDLTPLVAVPTTFAGADLSLAGSVSVPAGDGERTTASVWGPPLMPTAALYDPELYEVTPTAVLTGSAMNGFDKAVEAVYSGAADPITDATAVRSLRYLRESLPLLRDADDPTVIERAVVGIVLAQYGLSTPDGTKINVVHAYGHGLRDEFGVQQGVAHAVLVPHVLRQLFDAVDGRRVVLAAGLVDGEYDDAGTAVIEAVEGVCDGLGLPSRLRDVDGVSKEGLRRAAEHTAESYLLTLGPDGFDPSVDDIERTLETAW